MMKEIQDYPEALKLSELSISYEEKGKEIGKEMGKKEVALEMLKKGLDVSLITELTQLDQKEIEELRKQL